MAKILFVEDDPHISKSIQFNLSQNNISYSWAKSLSEAFSLWASERFDLVLTDLGLPDGSGLDLCNEISAKHPQVPILILTALGDDEQVIKGFESGAKDYIRKPFNNKELIARIKANLKTFEAAQENKKIVLGTLILDPSDPNCKNGDLSFKLKKTQHQILCYMAPRLSRVITRENLMQTLENEESSIDRTIDVHISLLRKVLKQNNIHFLKIKSVYGIGYRLECINE